MGRTSLTTAGLLSPLALFIVASCGSSSNGPPSYNFGDATTSLLPDGGDASADSSPVTLCPTPLGNGATVTGKVYDPAGKNPLYDVAVYVPAGPLPSLPRGVPTGANACSCVALYPTQAYASTSTAIDGTFTLTGVPLGTQSIVAQIGKWRRKISLNVACAVNKVPDRALSLPGSIATGDTDDSMPDIAVSTGGADSLECLLRRMGVAATEYVPGAATGGHVHVFSGGDPTEVIDPNSTSPIHGVPESDPMPGAPASSMALWATVDQLMPYDVVLLSCEGGETFRANPPALEAYLNAGGRAFASHYHYAWFAGPYETKQGYQEPNDWGAHLGTWTAEPTLTDNVIGGVVDLKLNDDAGAPFAKGASMKTWLGEVGALGQSGVPAGELSIFAPRYDVRVSPVDSPSQPWLTADSNAQTPGSTMYFSFDTPIGGLPKPDAGAGSGSGSQSGSGSGAGSASGSGSGAPSDAGVATDAGDAASDASVDAGQDATDAAKEAGHDMAQAPGLNYCGRAVFSDLHVGADPSILDTSPPPSGCANANLSPQEKALEFMLFDLSSCVTDDSLPVPDAGTVVIPPLH